MKEARFTNIRCVRKTDVETNGSEVNLNYIINHVQVEPQEVLVVAIEDDRHVRVSDAIVEGSGNAGSNRLLTRIVDGVAGIVPTLSFT